jgi:putative chitinase
MSLIQTIIDFLSSLFGGKPSAPAPQPQPPPPSEVKLMMNAPAFFKHLRDTKILGSSLEQSEVDGINLILKACRAANWPVSWVAYALATAFHETAGTMQPIREYGSNAYLCRNYDIQGKNPARAKKMGNTKPGDGVRYCGRGLVQLTWYANYLKAGRKLNIDLVNHPDLAMRPDIAARIMVEGMREGWFTGRDINDDLPATNTYATQEQFMLSRDVINGKDKAVKIAEEAMVFQHALGLGGWLQGA